MAVNFAYHYAEIDLGSNMCIGVVDTTDPSMNGYVTSENTMFVTIPVDDSDYIFKYYINGNWYEDAEGTIPWQSSLI